MYTIKCTIYYITFSKTQSIGHLTCNLNWLKCKICRAILSSLRPATAKPHPIPRLRQPGTMVDPQLADAAAAWSRRSRVTSVIKQELFVTIIQPETQRDACYSRSGFLWAPEESVYTLYVESAAFWSLWEFDRTSDVSLLTHLLMAMQWRCADK